MTKAPQEIMRPPYILSPAPIVHASHRTPTSSSTQADPSWSRKRQFEALVGVIERLKKDNVELKARLNAVETHCAIIMTQVGCLEQKLRKKKGRKTKSKTVGLKARWLTSREGLVQFDAIIAEQKAKKQKVAQAKERREAALLEKPKERTARGPTLAFTGSLLSKNKDNLTEIAEALALASMMPNGKKHTNGELLQNIKAHFNSHPELKDHPRFCGLFGTRWRRCAEGSSQTRK